MTKPYKTINIPKPTAETLEKIKATIKREQGLTLYPYQIIDLLAANYIEAKAESAPTLGGGL